MIASLLKPIIVPMMLVLLCCGLVQGRSNSTSSSSALSSAAFTHRQLTSSLAVTTLAGNGATGANDGIGTSATFNMPHNLCFSTDESFVLIAEFNNNRIRKYDMSTSEVTTVAGSSQGYENNIGTLAKFYRPVDVKIHKASGIFALITDWSNNRIRQLTLATGAVSTFVGNGATSDSSGIGTSASVYGPVGISISLDGSFAVISTHLGHKIGKLVIATRELSFLAGSSSGYQNGVGSNAMFMSPYFLAMSPDDSYALIALEKCQPTVAPFLVQVGMLWVLVTHRRASIVHEALLLHLTGVVFM